jgi:hypothetical protein
LPEEVQVYFNISTKPNPLKLFKKGPHYTVDVEVLKRALRELVEREPAFFRDPYAGCFEV